MDGTVQLGTGRRRSSILSRRSIASSPSVGQPEDTNSNKSENRTSELQLSSFPDQETKDENHLKRCIADLSIEESTWKSLRSERKLLKTSQNRIATPPLLSWHNAHEFLYEEDIAVLKDAPPHENIYKNYDRLVKEAARLRVKYDRCYNLACGIYSLVESRFDSIKRDIGEYSDKNLDLPEPKNRAAVGVQQKKLIFQSLKRKF